MRMRETTGSISYWISQLHAGGVGAEEAIWRRFHRRLLQLAFKVLPISARIEADEEDVVNGAFQSFFRRHGEGGFRDLQNRNDLWRLLTSITRRKAIVQIRRSASYKRRRDSEQLAAPPPPLEQHEDATCPSPETIMMQRETVHRLLAMLNDDLQQIALCKLSGLTNQEIAAQIRRSTPTVERRLRLIRQKWEGAAEALIQQ